MTTTATDRIHLLWTWCVHAYLRHGRHLALPARTDHTKTYQWRYLTALQRYLDDWGFDDELAQRFIDVAAAYSKEKKLFSKGLAIFFQPNMVAICYKRLQEELNRQEATLGVLEHAYAWMLRQQAGKSWLDLKRTLLTRPGFGAYYNIVHWSRYGQLPEIYLALSRACTAAITELTNMQTPELALLPRPAHLHIVRHKIMRDDALNNRIKDILQDDWRGSCS